MPGRVRPLVPRLLLLLEPDKIRWKPATSSWLRMGVIADCVEFCDIPVSFKLHIVFWGAYLGALVVARVLFSCGIQDLVP